MQTIISSLSIWILKSVFQFNLRYRKCFWLTYFLLGMDRQHDKTTILLPSLVPWPVFKGNKEPLELWLIIISKTLFQTGHHSHHPFWEWPKAKLKEICFFPTIINTKAINNSYKTLVSINDEETSFLSSGLIQYQETVTCTIHNILVTKTNNEFLNYISSFY